MTEKNHLNSFNPAMNVAIIGATGGIGNALCRHIEQIPNVSSLFRLSRSAGQDHLHIDITNEKTIAEAAEIVCARTNGLDLVIVATGVLDAGGVVKPEKSWKALSSKGMEAAFQINTIGPALVAKHFLPLLAKDRKSAFAVLSARVGSIEDNGLGGWYAYRASKAALNMAIKTLSIELARKNPMALCIALHPGTVDTALSAPFQSSVPDAKLFSPDQSAGYLLSVLNNLSANDTGGLYAWDGSPIPF